MKLMALAIALAMLCMVINACERYAGGGETFGQKIDRAIEKANQTVVQVGDKVISGVDQTGDVMSAAAATIYDTAWITTAAVGDAAITESIKTDLLKDSTIGAMQIDVETRDGVVSLDGLANDQAARARAERLARKSRGVTRVDNHLVVKQF